MSDEQRNTVWRFAMIFIVIFLGFCAVIGKIIYIQAVERDEWLKVAEKQVPTNKPIKATRGNILDCNGRLLASSMPQYYMYMDTRVPALHEKRRGRDLRRENGSGQAVSVVRRNRSAASVPL